MSKVTDFINDAISEIGQGWMIAALTDKYIVDSWPMNREIDWESEEVKVLEIRIFNADKELKLSRSDIGRDFSQRKLPNSNLTDEESYDEIQYLDIDEDKSKRCPDGMVYTTGGGKYSLPLTNVKNAKIRIRYYWGKYEKTGQAKIEDWRLVELVEESRDGSEK